MTTARHVWTCEACARAHDGPECKWGSAIEGNANWSGAACTYREGKCGVCLQAFKAGTRREWRPTESDAATIDDLAAIW